jgi:hypothetical protein
MQKGPVKSFPEWWPAGLVKAKRIYYYFSEILFSFSEKSFYK